MGICLLMIVAVPGHCLGRHHLSRIVRKPDFCLCHYENIPMLYTEICKVVKHENFQQKIFAIFLIFAQNKDFGYTLEAVLTSAHNLCFGAKIRKIGILLHTPVLLYKSGV